MFTLNTVVTSHYLQTDFKPHSAIIEVVATPFTVPSFPNQIFHSFHCKYQLCCQRTDKAEAVQQVEKAAHDYVLEWLHHNWDFSQQCCCILTDPLSSLESNISCLEATRLRLGELTRSADRPESIDNLQEERLGNGLQRSSPQDQRRPSTDAPRTSDGGQQFDITDGSRLDIDVH